MKIGNYYNMHLLSWSQPVIQKQEVQCFSFLYYFRLFCPHVSEYFLILNFFFPDVTASVHTHPANLAANPDIFESATNLITCGW